MSDTDFDALLASVEEMDQILRGEKQPGRVTEFEGPKVKEIREQTGLSQVRFAAMIGVSKRTLENWEQGRARPNAQAAILLRLIQQYPDTLERLARL